MNQLQKIPFNKFIPAITWFFIVLFVICLPGKDVPKVGWFDRIPAADKMVHIGMFGLLGVLFCRPFFRLSLTRAARLKYFISIAVAVSLWGLATEFIQKFFVPGRTFDLIDWAADSIGAILAFWLCFRKNIKV